MTDDARLTALALRAAEPFEPREDREGSSLSVVLTGGVQGAVHVFTDHDDAEGFGAALAREAEAEGFPARVAWALRTRGPHRGTEAGGLVLDATLQPPLTVHFAERVGAVRELTERSVLAIGKEMQGIWELSRTQASALRSVADQFASDAADRDAHLTIGHTIELLAGEMKRFGAEILERTQRQAQDIEQARAWTNDIVRLGNAIASIASNARLLTFNARLESARIGEAGRGFAVIAGSIQELALQVRETNNAVSALAQNLAAALPRLNHDALATSRAAEVSVSRLEQQLTEVQRRMSALRVESWEALQSSSATAADLQQRADKVVTHLQFQDRASQMLGEVQAQARQVMVAAGLVDSNVAADDAQVGDLGRTLAPSEDIALEGTVELF